MMRRSLVVRARAGDNVMKGGTGHGDPGNSYGWAAQRMLHPMKSAGQYGPWGKTQWMDNDTYQLGSVQRTKWRERGTQWLQSDKHGSMPHPEAETSRVDRKLGALTRFPGSLVPLKGVQQRYPNPRKYQPIQVSPRPKFAHMMSSNRPIARRQLSLEMQLKKVVQYTNYMRPQPGFGRTQNEFYMRMKNGLFDLDRILSPLWGPQEASKLDRDEWLFKLLYFLHPVTEAMLMQTAEQFVHNPFDNRKEIAIALDRLTSREYIRRVRGSKLNHPSCTKGYYWTLFPDETTFGERVVVEESYLQAIREGRSVDEPQYKLKRDFFKKDYQNKHNTFLRIEQERDLRKLKNFVEFCQQQKKDCVRRLKIIGKTTEFDDIEEEMDDVVYQDPPVFSAEPTNKIRWYAHGHWRESNPEGRNRGTPTHSSH
eukprot:Hpha_TRINITY_DN6167_c0_g1::TRINITY_DN6167_c0_g1_i2::g.164935::m.164935